MKSSFARGVALVAAAAVSWGTTGSVSTTLATHAHASPFLVGLGRMWVAAVVLVVLTRALGTPLAIAPADRGRTVGMGACMAAYQLAYFSAVPLAGISVTALVTICSAPLMIAALAAVFLREPVPVRVRIALLLGVIGAAMLTLGPSPTVATDGRFVVGIALAVTAGAAYAIYAVIAKASVATTSPLPLTAGTFGIAAIALTPVIALVDAPLRQVELGWPWLLYLGAVATAGAYALYTTGLRWIPASVAGIMTLLEPLTATLLGTLVFGERLTSVTIAGAALMFGALAVLLIDMKSDRSA